MARAFNIALANPIHFKIATDAGAINEGAGIPLNYIYPDSVGIENGFAFPVCPGSDLEKYTAPNGAGAHTYACGNTTDIQVYYDDDSTGSLPLLATFLNLDGTVAALVPLASMSQPYTDTNYYNINLDFSALTCPGCYRLQISTPEDASGVSIPWGDSGTFESAVTWTDNWSTGSGTNSRAQALAPVHGGLASARITAGIIPTSTNGQIFRDDIQLTLQPYTLYKISGFIYHDSISPFGSATDTIGWENTFTDATTLFSTVFTVGTDADDAWFEIVLSFRTGADTTGQFEINLRDSLGAVATPNSLGVVYLDDHTITLYDDNIHAESEVIQLVETVECPNRAVEYYGTRPMFGLNLDEALAQPRFLAYYPGMLADVVPTFGDLEQLMTSAGVLRTAYVRGALQYQAEWDWVSHARGAILAFALMAEAVSIDGVDVTATDAPETELSDDTLEVRIRANLESSQSIAIRSSC